MQYKTNMSLVEFLNKYSTEEACENQLFELKWPSGYKCEKCGCIHFYKISSRRLSLYQCKDCGYQATVTVNTVMERTHLSLTKWFLAIYLVVHDKRGKSALALSKDIEVAYNTSWLMLQKIRLAMGNRDACYKLGGFIELDDAYFGGPTKGDKRGRGTDKVKVIVGLSLDEIGRPLFAKIEVVKNIKGDTLFEFADRNIFEGATISSDAYSSYQALAKDYDHQPKKFEANDESDHLKWLHTVIANAKAFIAGTFHGLDVSHYQRYLNEFCYRFNRRFDEKKLFFRLLNCCASGTHIPLHELTA